MNKLKISIVALLSVTMLTACSLPDVLGGALPGMSKQTSEAPSTTDNNAEPPKPKFDTGGFKTEPGTLLKDTDAEVVRSVETFVMSDFVPLPYEVDAIVSESLGAQNVYGPGSLALTFTDSYIRVFEENQLVNGYINMAKAPTEKVNQPTFSVNQGLIRFNDPETALRVAEQLHGISLTETSEFDPEPDTKVEIPGLDRTLVSSTYLEYDDTTAYMAFTPYNEYVIYTWAAAPVAEEQWNAQYIQKYLDLQIPLLEQFPSVKTDAGFGKTDEYPSIDPAGMVVYTVRPREDDKPIVPGSYGPRGIAALFYSSKTIHDTLVQAGSMDNAKWESYVFRADNDFGAKSILNAFVSDNLQNEGVEYEEPQGVPDTTCTYEENLNGQQYSCFVINGRYVGFVSGVADTKKENQEAEKKLVSQKVAAQYEILKQADQNAGK